MTYSANDYKRMLLQRACLELPEYAKKFLYKNSNALNSHDLSSEHRVQLMHYPLSIQLSKATYEQFAE